MFTTFGGFGPEALEVEKSQLRRIVTSVVSDYPGSARVADPKDVPAKIAPCTDDNDRTFFQAYDELFGPNGELHAYQDKFLIDLTPDEGENYGKEQPKLTMKPNLNAKAVSALQYLMGRANMALPEYVELVDEEDVLQPLLLISKMCVLNMRRRAIREQFVRRDELRRGSIARTDHSYREDKRSWGIDIRRDLPRLEYDFNRRLKGLARLAGIRVRDIGAFMNDFEGRVVALAGEAREQELQTLDQNIREARTRLADEVSPPDAAETRQLLGRAQVYELKKREIYEGICSEQAAASSRTRYQLWAFLKSLTYDIKTGELYYPELAAADLADAARQRFVENEFETRNTPDVIQSELRHITIDLPSWEKFAFVDYFTWHNLIQIGQTKVGFLFLGGTGNGFLWKNLAGTAFVFDDEGTLMGEAPLSWRAELMLSLKPLRVRIAKEETVRQESVRSLGLVYRALKRLAYFARPDRRILRPSQAFFSFLNDLQLAGVWDGYNQIEDSERGSRLALFKLPARRLVGNYTQILEELLPALGTGWWNQRERWITLQTFWVVVSYPPALFMFIGQTLMTGFAFYALAAGTSLHVLAAAGLSLPAGLLLGAIIFYPAGKLLYHGIAVRSGMAMNYQWQQSPMKAMGRFGMRGWLKGYWVFQNIAILAAATLMMQLSFLMVFTTVLFGFAYFLHSVAVLKMSGVALVAVIGVLVIIQAARYLYGRLLKPALAQESRVKKAVYGIAAAALILGISAGLLYLLLGIGAPYLVEAVGAGHATGQIIFNTTGALSGIISQLLTWIRSWRMGAFIMVSQPFLILLMSIIALVRYEPENEASTSEAIMRMLVDEEYSYLKGFEAFMNDTTFLGRADILPQIQTTIDARYSGEPIALQMWQREPVTGAQPLNIKDTEELLFLLDLYKKWLDEQVTEAETRAAATADLSEREALRQLFSARGRPGFADSDVDKDASNENIVRDIKKHTDELKEIVAGQFSFSWKTLTFGAFMVGLAGYLYFGTGISLMTTGFGTLISAATISAIGFIAIGFWAYEKLYIMKHKRSPYRVGRLYYHMLQYTPSSPKLIEYFNHMYVIGGRNFVRNFLVVLLWWIPEGFWTRGRTPAEKKKLGQPFRPGYYLGRVKYFATARLAILFITLFTLYIIAIHPFVKLSRMDRLEQIRAEGTLTTFVDSYVTGLTDDISAIGDAFEKEELGQDEFAVIGYLQGFIDRYQTEENSYARQRALRGVVAMIEKFRQDLVNRTDYEKYPHIYTTYYYELVRRLENAMVITGEQGLFRAIFGVTAQPLDGDYPGEAQRVELTRDDQSHEWNTFQVPEGSAMSRGAVAFELHVPDAFDRGYVEVTATRDGRKIPIVLYDLNASPLEQRGYVELSSRKTEYGRVINTGSDITYIAVPRPGETLAGAQIGITVGIKEIGREAAGDVTLKDVRYQEMPPLDKPLNPDAMAASIAISIVQLAMIHPFAVVSGYKAGAIAGTGMLLSLIGGLAQWAFQGDFTGATLALLIAAAYLGWAAVRYIVVSRAAYRALRAHGLSDREARETDIARSDGYRHAAFYDLSPWAQRAIDLHERFESHVTGMLMLLPVVDLIARRYARGGEESAAIMIGVVGVSENTVAKIDREIAGIGLVALNEGETQGNLQKLEEARRARGAYASGIIEDASMGEAELRATAEKLVTAIEAQDRKIMAIAHPEIAGLSGETIDRIQNIEEVLSTIVARLPAIRSLRTSELSVYNMRMASLARELAALNITAADIRAITREKKAVSMRADSLGEVKLLAEAHRRRMNLARRLDRKAIPVELQVRLTVRKDDRAQITEAAKQALLERMEIADVLTHENLVLVNEEDLAQQTAQAIAEGLTEKGYRLDQIAVVDRLAEERDAAQIPQGILFVEYQDQFVTSHHYDAVLELMARPTQATLSEGFRFWFRIKPITKIDYQQLQKEMDKYREVLMAA
jgi:hypothetical protein